MAGGGGNPKRTAKKRRTEKKGENIRQIKMKPVKKQKIPSSNGNLSTTRKRV